MTDAHGDKAPAFLLIKGDASPEEVAALTVVLQAVAASGSAAKRRGPRPQWSAPARLQRPELRPGPGAWRASSLPR